MSTHASQLTSRSLAFRRGPFARVLAGLWMVVYLVVVTAVPVADAYVGHGDEIVAHWEDAEQSNCPASHAAGECQVCQILVSARALPASHVTPSLLGSDASRLPADAQRIALTATFLTGNSSRAPPLG
jgi:hypothetical protein